MGNEYFADIALHPDGLGRLVAELERSYVRLGKRADAHLFAYRRPKRDGWPEDFELHPTDATLRLVFYGGRRSDLEGVIRLVEEVLAALGHAGIALEED